MRLKEKERKLYVVIHWTLTKLSYLISSLGLPGVVAAPEIAVTKLNVLERLHVALYL
jgi:hypothetical protein